VVAQRMFGKAGEMMVIVMVLMAVVSTGSAEVLAATSIVVYDIYQLYLKVLFLFYTDIYSVFLLNTITCIVYLFHNMIYLVLLLNDMTT
jgi:Na+/proline symporter